MTKYIFLTDNAPSLTILSRTPLEWSLSSAQDGETLSLSLSDKQTKETMKAFLKDDVSADILLFKAGTLFSDEAQLNELKIAVAPLNVGARICLKSLNDPCGVYLTAETLLLCLEKGDISTESALFSILLAFCGEDIPIKSDGAFRVRSAADGLHISEYLARRAVERHAQNGVIFRSASGVLIDDGVIIEPDAVILPNTILQGKTVIKRGAEIGPNSLLSDCEIGENSVFNASQGYSSKIGANVTIGPFCHIRPNSVIKDGVHLGDFVEIKNSEIGGQTHVSHLTYVGDSDVGERVNFGCGVVTVNYNGSSKSRCVIGDDAFIGCNTNLVAPITVGKNGYTAAGSTITENVPDGALAVARARQINKEGYNDKLRPNKK